MKRLISVALCLCVAIAALFIAVPGFKRQAEANDVNGEAKQLLATYYNNGYYTKETEIFTDATGEAYFHAAADELIRRTTYTPGRLYMTTATTNGGYKDVGSDMVRFHVEDGVEVNDFTVYGTSVEAYYTDLEEMATIGTWEVVESKYVTAVTTEWVHFVAPMWIGDTSELTKVVMYENNGLVLELWKKESDSESESEFARACITKDSSEYIMKNGDFEDGLTGWTKVGNIGDVSSDTHYWLNDPESAEGYAFGMEGKKMFSAYAPGAEEKAVGTLTSPTFTVGGSGFVTFKVGAMKDGNYVFIDVVDAQTKQILARYYNGSWQDRTDDRKSGCTLVAYKADLSEHLGKEVFFRISDNADSNYGLFFVDSFKTYYGQEPQGFNVATPVDYAVSGTIYDLFNGGFELGDNRGWWNVGEIGVVTNATGYWKENTPYGKDGEYLFTGVESFGADTMREGNKGSLTSPVFEIGGTGWISFKLGGGGNEFCYVQVIDVATNEILARYHQQAQQDAVLIQYVADLSAHIGKTARIQVVDYASEGWGCVSFDSVVTYYASTDNLPAGHTANNIDTYSVGNGSFENGLNGWKMNIWEAGAHNTLGWVESSEHDAGWYTKNDGRKDGNNLFTFCRPDGTNCEGTKGELVSSTFNLEKGKYVSFRFGGAGTRDVYIQLVRADGTVIATFYNEAPGKANTEMYAYYYQYTGETTACFFRVYDNSVSNYGCFVVDDFRANLESAPEGFIAAIQ
ncbi:MAG: hypothetical protein IJN78_00020 [Clostridia bacterium]|nr:hypothetical protein [Clostridia bacterium]MBQ7042972.1 hypothetical protein [Clostridia bacterium]